MLWIYLPLDLPPDTVQRCTYLEETYLQSTNISSPGSLPPIARLADSLTAPLVSHNPTKYQSILLTDMTAIL